MRFPKIPCAAINWSDCHTTLVSTNTRGRRSKRNRRALRAARAGDLDSAQRILFAPLDLPPLYMTTAPEFEWVHRLTGRAEPELHFPPVLIEVQPLRYTVGRPPDGRSVEEHLDELRASKPVVWGAIPAPENGDGRR